MGKIKNTKKLFFSRNDYNPDAMQKPQDHPMTGPKMPNIDYSHSYGPIPQKVGPVNEMVGPVYPGVDPANQVFKYFF